MCVMYYDWNTDHRRWLKRCLFIKGDHIKKYSKGPTNCQAPGANWWFAPGRWYNWPRQKLISAQMSKRRLDIIYENKLWPYLVITVIHCSRGICNMTLCKQSNLHNETEISSRGGLEVEEWSDNRTLSISVDQSPLRACMIKWSTPTTRMDTVQTQQI